MNAPDSNHETPVDGLVDVHGNPSSSSSNVTEVQVSGIDRLGVSGDGFYSSSVDGRIVGMIGNMACSNPRPSKKRSSYYSRRSDGNKKRFIWAGEPHRCFLDSYNQLPEEKRVPKKITEDMRKAGCDVTRENVASHLQKHRLNLKGRENRRRNPRRPSSTTVPPNEEINSQPFHNGTSNSTNPNAVQIFQQSHSISTNPDFQSHYFSINPNSQLPIQTPPIFSNPNSLISQQSPSFSNGLNYQSHSLPNNPNSHLLFQSPSISINHYSHPPFHSPSFSNSTRSQSHSFTNSPSSQSHSFSSNSDQLPLTEPMVNQILSPFEKIHLYDSNAGYFGQYNHLSIRGGANSSDFSFGGTSNIANNSNLCVMANHFPDPNATNYQLVSKIDGFGNVIHPIPAYSRFGDLSGNDYSLGAHPNFYDYNMNMNLDHTVQVDGLNKMDMSLKFNFPFNSNVANDFQVNDIKQGLQSNFGPPGDNGVDNKPRLPQNFGSHPFR